MAAPSRSHLDPMGSRQPTGNPFATPSLLSVQSGQAGRQSREIVEESGIEMRDGAVSQHTSKAANRPTFLERWRQADEGAYLATIGRLGSSKSRRDEKAAAAGVNAGAIGRRRSRPWVCTIVLTIVLLAIIIVIVVPIAIVYSRKNSPVSGSEQPSTPSTPGSGPAPIPNSNIVSLKQGQYQGTVLSNGVTEFLGMQYAAPPTGDLRFAAPQPPVQFDGVKSATKYGPSCHGLGDFKSAENEDCLYLDVFVPTNTTNQSKLPVYVFIQGGGLQYSDVHYNGSSLITASGFQMITVTMTYRVNAFGFLASAEIQDKASLNNGLKDQRMALQWVQDNIAQFGGDPTKVVLAGESGGAGSAVMQLVAFGGRDDHLFQAAALESQSLQAVRNVRSSQYQYDYIVGNTTCHNAKDTLTCLRGLSIQGLVKAITNSPFPDGAGGNPVFPYNPVIDDDFLLTHPIASYLAGKYVDVPIIFGDDTDEGTIFVTPSAIQTKQDSEDFLRNTYPLINNTVLSHYSTLYNFSDTSSSDYWRNVAAAYGETRYSCPGIQLSNIVSAKSSKVWYFQYDVTDPTASNQDLGVKHGSELPAIFGPSSSAPVSYKAGGDNSGVVPLMQAYWTSFVKHFDPNVEKLSGAPTWDNWQGNQRLHVVANGTAMEGVDDGLAARCKYLNSIAVDIGQ